MCPMALHALMYATTALHKTATVVLRSIQRAPMCQVVVVADSLFLLVHPAELCVQLAPEEAELHSNLAEHLQRVLRGKRMGFFTHC